MVHLCHLVITFPQEKDSNFYRIGFINLMDTNSDQILHPTELFARRPHLDRDSILQENKKTAPSGF